MVFTWRLPSCEINSEESVQPLDPLQFHVPALQECHIGTAGHEVAHDTGYKDFAAMCVAGDAGGVVDSRAEEIVGLAQSVTSVNASAVSRTASRPIGATTGIAAAPTSGRKIVSRSCWLVIRKGARG